MRTWAAKTFSRSLGHEGKWGGQKFSAAFGGRADGTDGFSVGLESADTVDKVGILESRFFRREQTMPRLAAIFPMSGAQGVIQRDISLMAASPAKISNGSPTKLRLLD